MTRRLLTRSTYISMTILMFCCVTSFAQPAATQEIECYGRPEGKIYGQERRYYVWCDQAGWHLRTTTNGPFWNFEGKIKVIGGRFKSARPISLEFQKEFFEVNRDRTELTFRLVTGNRSDGINFTVEDGVEVVFDLNIGGDAAPRRTFIGPLSQAPQTMPFRLPAAPERPKAVRFAGTDDFRSAYRNLKTLTFGQPGPSQMRALDPSFKPTLVKGAVTDRTIAFGVAERGSSRAVVACHPLFLFHDELVPRHLTWLQPPSEAKVYIAHDRAYSSLKSALGPWSKRLTLVEVKDGWRSVTANEGDILLVQAVPELSAADLQAIEQAIDDGCHIMLAMAGYIAAKSPEELVDHPVNRLAAKFGVEILYHSWTWRPGDDASIYDVTGAELSKVDRQLQ